MADEKCEKEKGQTYVIGDTVPTGSKKDSSQFDKQEN